MKTEVKPKNTQKSDLLNSRLFFNRPLLRLVEILLVFAAGLGLIQLLLPLAGDHAVIKQLVIWSANILMLLLIGVGMKLRGNKLKDFGIAFGSLSLPEFFRKTLQSLGIFVLATLAFIIASIVMANFSEIPESADLSDYAYMQNNLPMLLLTLLGVWIVSSFGEEIIYRAYLINHFLNMGFSGKSVNGLAVLVSAIIFGLVHYEWGIMGMAQTTAMGLVLGAFYLKLNKSIWPLVLAHAYMDTLLMLQMYFASI